MQIATHIPPLICASHTITGVLPGAPARHPFEDRVRAVADAGFDGLVIHFRDHMRQLAGGADPGALRDCVAQAGLTVSAVEFLADWHGGASLGSLDLALETARLFGAGWINVGADLAGRDLPPGDLVEPFRRLTDVAGNAGIGVALEVISWGTIASVDTAQALLEAAEGPAGLLLDNWHLAFGKALAGGLPDPSLVAGLQISDALTMSGQSAPDLVELTQRRLFPGEGDLDISGFLAALWPAALRHGVAVEVISGQATALTLTDCAERAARSGRCALIQAARMNEEGAAHG